MKHFCNSTESSANIKRFLFCCKFRYLQNGLSAVCWVHNLNRKWSKKQTWKLIFFLFSMFASPKNASCFFYIYFCARNIKPAAAMPMSSSLMLLDAPDDVFISPQLSTVFGQDKTLKHPVNDCVLSDLCVCVDSNFTSVSVLFMFCFCFSQFRVDPT